MVKDLDRKITQIKYNILNLPEEVLFENGHKITNLYAADGRKLNSRYLTNPIQVTEPIIRDSMAIKDPFKPLEKPGLADDSIRQSIDSAVVLQVHRFLFRVPDISAPVQITSVMLNTV